MDSVFFLILRRIRVPLLWLVGVHSIAVLGLTLIPGEMPDGRPWHMDLFHAFYFVSFMATTIGFGEIPYPFSDLQRLWVLFSIYATVVVWIYAIGTLLTLLQDSAFQHTLVERRFTRLIRHLREPFFLICGYGETGRTLVHSLTERDKRVVVIDAQEERAALVRLENLREYVPVLQADARRPAHLLEAGLDHPHCCGVVALTDDNQVNLKVAITSKLLRPDLTVTCRADSHDVEANMASFGTDYIFDPFDIFAVYLATALESPCLHLLHEWLTGDFHETLPQPIYPPRKGLWVVAGYGRFGKAVRRRLKEAELDIVVIEATPDKTGEPGDPYVVGQGTEMDVLEKAGIQRAVGLVAGTDNDATNLAVIMAARSLNPDLFVVARQNQLDNGALFEALHADMVMHHSAIVADRIRVLLTTPLLALFDRLAMYQDDAWACELISRIAALVEDEVPSIWEVTIEEEQAYAPVRAMEQGGNIRLGHLLQDPRDRDRQLPIIPLLMSRNGNREVLPASNIELDYDDRLLLCGTPAARTRMECTLQSLQGLNYVLTGLNQPQGLLWRKLAHWRKRRSVG